jgi:hypothetical protein
MQEEELPIGEKVRECVFSPHSMRGTTATLLLDSGVPIESLQDLLDHKHITTTQICDKRRSSVRDDPQRLAELHCIVEGAFSAAGTAPPDAGTTHNAGSERI